MLTMPCLRSISASQVRCQALLFITQVVKQLPKRLVNVYWPSFLPQDWQDDQSPNLSLLTSLHRELAPQAQHAALGLVQQLLAGSQQFVASAADSHRGGFTSLSQSLAGMLEGLHVHMLGLLGRANTTGVRAHCLKASHVP